MGEMSDRGFVSGFIGVGIHMTIQHILQDIRISNCCKKELADLKELVMGIDLTIMHIQQNLMAFKSGEDKDTASAVNDWLGKLDSLLLDASKMVQRCSIPKSRLDFSGRPSKKEIWSSIKAIREHLELSPLLVRIPEEQVGILEDQAVGDTQKVQAVGDTKKVLEGLGKTKDSLESLASSATTSQTASKDLKMGQNQAFENVNLKEQEKAFADLERFVIDDVEAHKIGVVGNNVAAKSLLKTVFNRQKVRNHFSDGLLLWLSLSESPSVTSVVNDLCTQIAVQQKKDVELKEEDKENWLKEQLTSRFALFIYHVLFDDTWGMDVRNFFEKLGIVGTVNNHMSNSKVIVSSSDITALSNMGVADEYTITIQNLNQDGSWQLFKDHAFPYPDGQLPSNIDENKATLVCNKCEGLPLAIKVVGAAMASSTQPEQWEWALDRLENVDSLDDYLKLSFDALGNQDFNMQLCFLHIAAAFLEGAVIDAQEVIPLWMGEGLLARKKVDHVPRHVLADHCLIEPMIRNTEGRPVCLRLQDPFEIGRLYLDLLAERCLIEPTARDAEGRVLCFRMLNVVRDCAIPVAQDEESFYHCVDCSLKDMPKNEISKSRRIFLSRNDLNFLPQFSSSSEMCSLLISQNTGLTKIPKKVVGSMLSLKVLDLSGTSALSLPKNVGCLKELRCLKLAGTKIKTLPKSLRDLGHLEILDVSFTDIKELPSDIHMLRSLRYLGLRGCEHLQNLPYSISGLLSLQYLYMDGCCMWRKRSTNKCKNAMDGCRKGVSLQSLGDLIQLKQLALQNDWEAIPQDTTLKGMTEMDTLLLVLAEMVSLPLHISDMSKLRRLSLKCSKLSEINPFVCFNLTETQVKMKNDVTHLKNLSYLKFYECSELKNFQHLHMLPNLIQLEIILCPKVENFPPEFGRIEAFPSLKTFSLVGLHNLQGLPERENGAMPYLEIFSMIDCPKLRMPQSYLNLGSRIRIRLYGCPVVNVEEEHTHMVQQVLLPNPTQTKEIIKNYLEIHRKKEKWLYGECWCNELCNELFQATEDMRTSS